MEFPNCCWLGNTRPQEKGWSSSNRNLKAKPSKNQIQQNNCHFRIQGFNRFEGLSRIGFAFLIGFAFFCGDKATGFRFFTAEPKRIGTSATWTSVLKCRLTYAQRIQALSPWLICKNWFPRFKRSTIAAIISFAVESRCRCSMIASRLSGFNS